MATGYDPVTLHSSGAISPDTSDDTFKGSYDSHAPLNTYPPMPAVMGDEQGRYVPVRDAEQGQAGPAISMPEPRPPGLHAGQRNSSWDILSGIASFQTGYEEFDSRNTTQAYLEFAEGDIPQNRFTRFYHYLLASSVVTRWTLFILPVLAILWIPGILGLTAFPNAEIWGVKFKWWSIWLSVFWGGWWASLAAARSLPWLARTTIGVVAVGARRYIAWLVVLDRYVALVMWSLASWITFGPLIDNRQESNASSGSKEATDLAAKLLFALFVDMAILAGEKFSIQWIAGKFHERSYAERIADQKVAMNVLTILYRNSRDIPGRSDTLGSKPQGHARGMSLNPKHVLKRALKGVRYAATTTTTALGTMASEMAGSSVLQPNSPQAMVQTAMQSANKSRLLARRLFYSFCPEGRNYLLVDDIARFFPSAEQATIGFSIFDKDGNGDVTRDELEAACLESHREQLSIEHSMRDLDSAVGRLDNILMTLYAVAAILIVAVALDTNLVSLVTGAGTLIIALSWLVGDSLSEVLSSIIFLFVKHPYDVSDFVYFEDGDEEGYTVKEIRLLSTIFLNSHGCLVQAPNTVLNGKLIRNVRRSQAMSEPFTFEVAFETTFEAIEDLRARMLLWLKGQGRDFQQAFDVTVVDIPEQAKMILRVDIKYKSNWQQGALKSKRRNKWICMLKSKLAEIPIYGPSGNPNSGPGITRYTQVPWETVQADDARAKAGVAPATGPHRMPTEGWHLSNSNLIMNDSEDVFGDASELRMPNPQRGLSTQGITQRPVSFSPSPLGPSSMQSAVVMPSPSGAAPSEFIEMRSGHRTERFEGMPR